MPKKMSSRSALAQARKLVAEGKVTISNAAYSAGPNAVCARGFKNGIEFSWSREGIGFGALTLFVDDTGKLRMDREGMRIPFCLEVIEQAMRESGD